MKNLKPWQLVSIISFGVFGGIALVSITGLILLGGGIGWAVREVNKEEVGKMVLEAKESSVKYALSSINRGQKGFHFDNSRFTENIDELGFNFSDFDFEIEIHFIADNSAYATAVPLVDSDKLSSYITKIDYEDGGYKIFSCKSIFPGVYYDLLSFGRCSFTSSEIDL